MVHFNLNLRFLRIKSGWKQEELASMLGVKPNTISNYETGASKPDFDLLEIIIKKFGVKADEMLYLDLTNAKGMDAINQDQSPSNASYDDSFNFMKTVVNKLDSLEKSILELKQHNLDKPKK